MTEQSRRILAGLSRPAWLTDEVLGIYERGCPGSMTDQEWQGSLEVIVRSDAPVIPSYVANWDRIGWRVVPGREREAEILFAADAAATERRWGYDTASGLYTCAMVRERRIVTEAPQDADHYLEPGDVCVGDAGVFGVVVRSQSNTEQTLLVKFGADPVRDYAREDLRWAGEID